MRSDTRVLAVALVVVVALAGLSTGAVADGGDTGVERIGHIEVAIEDEHVHIDGLELSGDGLPSAAVDERTYVIDSFSLQTDGVTVEFGDTTYEICSVDISLENVGVTVTDSEMGDE